MNDLHIEVVGRGYAWLDTGTHDTMMEASMFIKTIEHRQGLKISCIEEIAYLNGWIDDDMLKMLAMPLMNSGYGDYLLSLIRD